MRVLLVEDDAELQGQLQRQLERMEYQVCVAGDGQEGLYYAREYDIDIAIVDVGLPRMDGIELIQYLRKNGYGFPVLILTARSGWQDKVKGLETGADDYLAKPFQMEELKARVKALLRRSTGAPSTLLKFGSITLDLNAQSVSLNDNKIDLTTFEYRLLEQLARHQGEVLSKQSLTDYLYPHDEDRDSNVLEVMVGRLRRKLDPDGTLAPIETLRGRGYRFTLSSSA